MSRAAEKGIMTTQAILSKNEVRLESCVPWLESWSELCWDGKRRTTARITPEGISYLERFISIEVLRLAVLRADAGARRFPCDYL